MMLQITAIQDIAAQGFSEPYHCMASDGRAYFVKGLRSRRSSQINEWLCANMAVALGLPIAPFALLNVSEELFDELTPNQRKIGLGAAFGSQALFHQTTLLLENCASIEIDLKRKIVVFDWLIHNMDRTMGNPNLLFQASTQKLSLIDHNLAFDPEFNPQIFLETHIFREEFDDCLADLQLQAHMLTWLQTALPAFQAACNSLPPEWLWLNNEQDLPSNYPFHHVQNIINRITNGTLWSTL